jgi:transketolase
MTIVLSFYSIAARNKKSFCFYFVPLRVTSWIKTGKTKMKMKTRVHAKNLVQWAKDKPEVLVLSADLTSNTEVKMFREAYPDRFLSMGMTEQNIVSFAGGLAREGFVPFFHTFAIFIYRRALDQISMSVAYPNLKVRLVGFLPGITTPGGATHQATDDVGILRTLPNMTIVEPGDANEVAQVLEMIEDIDGPVYIRQQRGAVPVLFDENEPMQFNRARQLRKAVTSPFSPAAFAQKKPCVPAKCLPSAVFRSSTCMFPHINPSPTPPFSKPHQSRNMALSRWRITPSSAGWAAKLPK